MAIAKNSDTTQFRPVNKTVQIIRRFTAGTGGVAAGDIVSMGSDGVIACDGNGASAKVPVGIAIKTAAATELVDVQVYGPITGFTGATIGATLYPDDTTPGAPSESPSTNKYRVGVMESATICFVAPGYVA